MKYIIKIIGNGEPRIALVGCVHGDEIIGKKLIESLKKIKLDKGSVALIIAHTQAVKEKKRFFKQDLNRSFPGRKNGIIEERLAYQLLRILKNYDLIIDVHATNSNFKSLAVVTRFNVQTRELLKYIPIKNIAVVYKKVFGGKEMIAHCKAGISLDYGPDKTGKNYKRALSHVKIILKNLGFLPGKKIFFKKKDLYRVSGAYMVPKNFKQKSGLREFCFIKKGQVIGYVGKKSIKARYGFCPLFLGKGRYENTLALIARKENINL